MKFTSPKMDVMMSHIFASHRTVRALEAIGADRTIHLIDNSFNADMAGWASVRPFVNYIRDDSYKSIESCGKKVAAAIVMEPFSHMEWYPFTLSASWNLAIEAAEAPWVINVNPDTLLWPTHSLGLMERALENIAEKVVLIRTQLNFNLWAGRVEFLKEEPFDTRFSPCGGEDEDMLVRISHAHKQWTKMDVPAHHMDGGHKDRVDGYRNVKVFEDKWGWRPHSPEWNAIVSEALVKP